LEKEINNPLVSVIVPCFNYAHFLGEALDSVLAQTYTNWECIIINDGSPDNTEEVAMNYCRKDNRFKYYWKENGGHSSARNFGVSNSFGKYILPLDADDKISDDYLKQATEVLENTKNVKLVTGQVQQFGDVNERFLIPVYTLRSYLIVNYISISSLFRRSDFDEVKGFDETMLGFEDWDLFIKILKDGGEVVQLPFCCLYYRKKNGSMFQNVLNDKSVVFKDLLQLYNNNADVYRKYFDNPVYLIQENEKLNRVIKAYQQSRTYKIGLKVRKFKSFLQKK
jgi:glycosyltransferase involved in cell wall biosynthesis